MNGTSRHPAIGTVTLIAGLLPLLVSAFLVRTFGLPLTEFPMTLYVAAGATAVLAGVLLCIGRGPQYGVSVLAWVLLIAIAVMQAVARSTDVPRTDFGPPITHTPVDATPGPPEVVMLPGTVIEATTPSGHIKIEATEPFTRRYAWGSYQKTFTLEPRPVRWLGSKGISRGTGDKQMHVVLEEGQHHFYSEQEALAWLAWQQERMRWVYTSDGLVVGWYESRSTREPQHAFIANVLQLYIQGRKPDKLDGADDRSIRVTKSPSEAPAIGAPISSAPTTINGRWFSGKAIDYMKELNISAAQVEEVIARTGKTARGKYLWQHGWDLKPMIKFSVCTDSDGKVWLVV